MKFLFSLLLISSLINQPLKAQYMGKPIEYAISAGASFPRWDFGEKDHFGWDGFARIGTNITGDLNLFYWKHMAIGLSLHSNFNSINKKALKEWYDERLYHKTDVEIKAGVYWINSLMFYPVFLDFRGKKFGLQLKPGLGYSFCRHPNINVNDDTYGRIVKINSDWDIELTTGNSVAFSYQLNDQTKFLLEYNRYYLIPSFTNDNYPNNTYAGADFYDLEMLHHSLNLGYVYHF